MLKLTLRFIGALVAELKPFMALFMLAMALAVSLPARLVESELRLV